MNYRGVFLVLAVVGACGNGDDQGGGPASGGSSGASGSGAGGTGGATTGGSSGTGGTGGAPTGGSSGSGGAAGMGGAGASGGTSGDAGLDASAGTAGLDASDGASGSGGGTGGSAGAGAGGAGGSLTDAGCQGPVGGTTITWNHAFGTPVIDRGSDVVTDASNNVFVLGTTSGKLGDIDYFGQDAFVRKYDPNGTGDGEWTYQFGINNTTTGVRIIMDGDGDLIATGLMADQGKFDFYVHKFEDGATGATPVWMHQYGTDGDEYVFGLATDISNNIYVVGRAQGDLEGESDAGSAGGNDAFVAKLAPDGTRQWVRQYGTAGNDEAVAVSVDATGHIAVVGWTPSETFLRVYTSSGNLAWSKEATGMLGYAAVASRFNTGEIFVAGGTKEKLGCQLYGNNDGFVRKFDASGNIEWTEQFPDMGAVFDMALDGGAVYVAGYGVIPGSVSGEAMVKKVDASSGATLWLQALHKTSVQEFTHGVTTDSTGAVLAAGWIQSTGIDQAFVAKLVP